MNQQISVLERYSEGAKDVVAELCCPVEYIGISPVESKDPTSWCIPVGTVRPPDETKGGSHGGGCDSGGCCG